MNRINVLAICCIVAVWGCFAIDETTVAETAVEPQKRAFQAVPFTSVHFNDSFWAPRLKTNREISIPHNYTWCEDTGRFTNFAKAAKLMDGKFQGIYFNDSDVYKLLEGTAYSLADHPAPELKKRADSVIDWIAAAQQPNGYLNSYYELAEPDKKWTNTRVRHELYCAGHLTEAAVAYFQATGDRKLLDVTEKFIAHIMDTFGRESGKKVEVPGHEEIELALVKLYQLTKNPKYLDLATFFIDVRGDQTVRTDTLQGPYSQDHKPVRQQEEIVGHAVRAMYLFAGVADVAGYTADKGLIKAMDTLWNDVVNKKMYITGGIGARHQGEAFGDAFELPNNSAYCETCAAIGLVFWAHRLNLMHGDPKFADVVERCIYNGVLSGIGKDGKSFFYVNPLASVGTHHRQPFYPCACCPTNVVRFVPSLPGYQYGTDENGIIVNQYIAGDTVIEHPKFGEVQITMTTNYPWDGQWTMEVVAAKNANELQVRTRIPAKGYSVVKPTTVGTSFVGTAAVLDFSNVGTDATFTGNLPMKVVRMVANPHVEADRGRVAIMRGPLVYCFEQCDNDVAVDRIILAKEPEFRYQFKPNFFGAGDIGDGIGVITCKNVDGRTLTAVPYFAWDTRSPGKMAVWVRQDGLTQKPDVNDTTWNTAGEPILYRELDPSMFIPAGEMGDEPLPLVERIQPSASFCANRDTIEALLAGSEPTNSNDHTIPRLTFWPHKGTAEWVEYSFDTPETLDSVSVYWFDDEPRGGGCRVPKSWNLQYRQGDKWVPVKTTDTFGTAKDGWQTVSFDKVTTDGLRMEIQLQTGFSGGILGWTVRVPLVP